MSSLITEWYKWDAAREAWQFNHVSTGYYPEIHRPDSVCSEHQRRAWEKAKWKPVKARLIDNKVVPYEQ